MMNKLSFHEVSQYSPEIEMIKPIQTLVFSPRPMPGESLKGFILRTSEANGYQTPSVMLSVTGMTSGDMRRNVPPIEKLIPLYGCSEDEFASMGYRYGAVSRNSSLIPIRHYRVPSIYVSGQHPKICPECILERGNIDAFWDLKYAIACPIHNKKAIQQCPECGNSLHWFRPGLLTCRCGYDLSLCRGEAVEHLPTLGLLGLIRNKLLDEPLDYVLLKDRLGFAVEHLEPMCFTSLIGVIGRFEGRAPESNYCDYPHRKHTPIDKVLSRAANALANWPHGLYQYLKDLDAEGQTNQGYGLRIQFKSFYEAFFKASFPVQEVAFIKEAFVSFGTGVWKKAYVTDKLDGGTGQGANLVGIYGLANALGVMPSTARNLVMKEQIPSVTVTFNGRSRQLFDLEQDLPFQSTVSGSISLREAARRLDLPVSVLAVLRKKKEYEVKRIANPLASYHEEDVRFFRDKLMKMCPDIKVDFNEAHIALKQVMRMKTGSCEIKAAFVTAIINEKLISLGRTGDSVGEMVFKKVEVDEFLREIKSEYFGYTTVVSAAKFLHSDPPVVKNLYRDGLLLGEKKPNGLFILESSIKAFDQQYVSCAAVATKLGMSSQEAKKRCEAMQICIHWFPRGHNESFQPFISRKDAEMHFLNECLNCY